MYDVLDAFNESTQYISLLASYWIILFESLVQRRNKRAFWRTLNCCENGKDISIGRSYLIEIIEYLLISSVANAIALYWNIELRNVWIAYMLLVTANHIRIFFYIMHLEIIKSKLEQVKQELFVENVTYTSDLLRAIRCKHYKICKLIANINDTCNISHLSALMSQLYFFYSNLNWTYLHFNTYTGFYIFSMYSENKRVENGK